MSKKNDSVIVTPSKKKGESKVKIIINDELTIYSIEDIYKRISTSIKKYDEIEFDLSNVSNIDLTFVQLIISLKKSGKKVDLNVKLTPENELLFKNTDLIKILEN